jgi:hypothetical protein
MQEKTRDAIRELLAELEQKERTAPAKVQHGEVYFEFTREEDFSKWKTRGGTPATSTEEAVFNYLTKWLRDIEGPSDKPSAIYQDFRKLLEILANDEEP